MQVLAFGVLTAVLLNLVLLVLLRYVIRCLFYIAVLAILLLLAAIDLALYSKAGLIDLAAAADATLAGASSSAAAAATLLSSVDNEQVAHAADAARVRADAVLTSAHDTLAASTATLDLVHAASDTTQLEHYAIAAHVMVGFTALVLVFVCLLLSRLERSLEVRTCRATSEHPPSTFRAPSEHLPSTL